MTFRKWMVSMLAVAGPAIWLVACKPAEPTAVTAIVGAVLIDGSGGPPISDSVVTVENGRIRAAGSRSSLPIPAEAEKIDGSGKFLIPAPIDVLRPNGSDKPRYLVLHSRDPDAVRDRARRDGMPLFGDVSSLADAHTMVDRGATGLLHMIRDTETIDPVFIARLRDLRIACIPMLAEEHDAAKLGIAERNTKRLADGGVPIAVGSGRDPNREMELLAEAGLTPSEVLIAATRNGAAALKILDETGTIEPGKRADLLLLSANPAEDVRNIQEVDRAMRDGQWVNR